MTNILLKDGQHIITPDTKTLIEEENVCPVQECDRKFQNASALRFHVEKSHGIKEQTHREGQRKKYACPSMGCSRHVKSSRQMFFKNFHAVKKHYLSCHAEKKHLCEKCGKAFGWKYTRDFHELKCRQLFNCSCGVFYTTVEAVNTHIKAKGEGHKLVEEEQNAELTSQSRNKNSKPSSQMVVPAVLYIPNSLPQQNQNFLPISDPGKGSLLLSHAEKSINTKTPRYIRILPNNKQRVTSSRTANNPSPNASNLSPGILSSVTSLNLVSETAVSVQETLENTSEAKSTDMVFKSASVKSDFLEQQSGTNNKVVQRSKETSCGTVNKELKPHKKYKQSKLERDMKYLASNEVQGILSNSMLICNAMIRQKINRYMKNRKCRCRKQPCKHIKKMSSDLTNQFFMTSYQRMATPNDIYNEIGSTPTNLADMCTQTPAVVPEIDEPAWPSAGQLHCKNNLSLPVIEVLETSDFSTQCQLPVVNDVLSGSSYVAMDTQTQTDDLDSWLNSFGIQTGINMETQTTNTQSIVTQTEYINENNNPVRLDKSIQLDDLWDSTSINTDSNFFLTDSSNIGTQTYNWLNDNFDPLLLNEQCSMSTQTNSQFDIDFEKIEFTIERKDFAAQVMFMESDTTINEVDILDPLADDANINNGNSTTQTNNQIDHHELATNSKNSMETQTCISFHDLLDSSFIDEYLNETSKVFKNDTKSTSSSQTQTESQSSMDG